MGGQADEHMSRLNWSPTAPVLSIVDEGACSLRRAPSGANLSPGHMPLSAVATAHELAAEST